MRCTLVLVGLLMLQVSPSQSAVLEENSSYRHVLYASTHRPADAPSGSQFAARTAGRPGAERQAAAVRELKRGNIPSFLRNLKPVTITGTTDDQRTVEIVIWVTPDYLSIGSDKDFLRIPLGYPSAVRVANAYHAVLPTKKMVDAIFEQSSCRLKPAPMPAGPKMTSTAYFVKHSRTIEKQRRGHCALGELVAGHKKDVVLTNRLHSKPGRVAIYGWHRDVGDPIQPLSTVHVARYADYSHGIRLVDEIVWVNGKPRSIFEVLQDPDLAGILTYEGELERPKTLMSAGM